MSQYGARSDNACKGIALITAAVFLLALADAAVKYFSATLPLWQLFLIVSCLSVPALGTWLGRRIYAGRLRITSVPWVMARSVLLLLMWVTYYAALPLIPLSVAAVAIYTTPLFIALFSTCYGGEPLSVRGWTAVGIGFAGVAMVLRPGSEIFSLATLLPVIAAVFYALAMVVTRRHCRSEHPLVLALGLNIGFLVAAGIGGIASLIVSDATVAHAPFLLSPWQTPGWQEMVFIVCYACALILINTATARAYQIAPPALVGTFDYAYLAFACLWGYLLFQEVPDGFTWTGMLLILIAGLLVFRAQKDHR
ncbi:DMT family transporter [Pseudomonas sp. SWRI153]|uniref:DMT family transporter n=1 Tax=Pseudomonas khorasanensis TaxID=2745508 RepID=A0A923F156_9PSED|nr:DMT family transporter [Pseudomonas khorasanensis]MBV4484970.1 DMT family transporter [Pseudomonas khorasanensis]